MQSVVLVDYFLPKNYYTYELCSELSKYADVTLICKDSYQCKSHELFHIMPVLHSIPDKNKLRAVKKYMGDLKKFGRLSKNGNLTFFMFRGLFILNLKCFSTRS